MFRIFNSPVNKLERLYREFEGCKGIWVDTLSPTSLALKRVRVYSIYVLLSSDWNTKARLALRKTPDRAFLIFQLFISRLRPT